VVVLERLSPAERVAFVLHDIFGVPFDAIAETVGRPEATCRQLARRARVKLDGDGERTTAVSPDQHRLVTDRFIAACANGRMEDLLAVLDPEVTGGVDLRPGLVVHGSESVARNLVHFWGRGASLVSLPGLDSPCLLAFTNRDLAALFSLTVLDERVTEVHVYAAPRVLKSLRRLLLPASGAA
jgi:RNA polymerase sigma-70 factor (ECF subfamily)